jgi:hypothetical protein
MAATDTPFPRMSLPDILRLRSASECTCRWHGQERTVAEVLPCMQEAIAEDLDGRYGRLRESMRTHGQTAPIFIYHGGLGDGHHRVAMALELGWTSMFYCADELKHLTTDPLYDKG